MLISSEMISGLSVLLAAAALVVSLTRDSNKGAAEVATLSAQLSNIMSGVDDIRVELRTMRSQVSTLEQRTAVAEAKIKNLEKEVFSGD